LIGHSSKSHAILTPT